jgi:hypothetical protein
MKSFTQIILILLLTFTINPVYGEDEGEIYYCSSSDTNGFSYNKESDSYKRAGFGIVRFKLKIDTDHKSIKVAGDKALNGIFPCTKPFSKRPAISCADNFNMYNINTETGRFVWAAGYGHVVVDKDSITISIGKCDKF